MAVVEAQVPLPAPPTGVAIITARHEYNPENGHYEPSIRGLPQNEEVDSGTLAVPLNLIVFAANARPVWIYHIVLANTSGAAETCELTEPGGRVYTVEVPANITVIVTSTPDAPLFVARPTAAASNLTFGSDVAGAVTATITYVIK